MGAENGGKNRSHIFTTIRTNYHRLSTAQKRVADYILSNSREVLYLSISELAERCEVSETTIVRFLKKIDYSSYQVFRVEIAQINEESSQDLAMSEISSRDSTATVIDKVISSTATALSDIRDVLSETAVEESVAAILRAERVPVFGVGASFYIAGDLYHKLSRLGIRAITESDDQMIALLTAHTGPLETFVLVSHSGESSTILDCAREAKRNGATVCALTSYAHSTLAGLSDFVLLSSSSETKYRPDAMLSRIIQIAIVDVISISALLQMGSRAKEAIVRSQRAVARHKR
jgi:DNA-binding MurR/RpiR family transcriptional regulator